MTQPQPSRQMCQRPVQRCIVSVENVQQLLDVDTVLGEVLVYRLRVIVPEVDLLVKIKRFALMLLIFGSAVPPYSSSLAFSLCVVSVVVSLLVVERCSDCKAVIVKLIR
eukprot:Blabericola_migrator_1__11030@NODE_6403_length_542_cov_161_545263_g4354_i0_p2_GENE_NODE_6403_length_542_cov_161_545263_g4354_i0NODE_6403_length_542_cov_161_545263_g4354_i0_p2_ORF_typecomplete_len109_score8_02_NODE_6403_length_542_cov_161_545263_g4354_i070396